MRRAEKVASRAVFTPSEGKRRRVKTQVMRQKWAFSTLISIGKVKRIYRKRMEKVDEISEYPERKRRINKDKTK